MKSKNQIVKTDVTHWPKEEIVLNYKRDNDNNNNNEKVPKRTSFVRKKFNDGPPVKGASNDEAKYNIVSGK